MLRLTFRKLVLEFKKGDKRESSMAAVYDVAKYILHKQGTMTTMKLQKLVYYCQAWSTVWDEKPLFEEKIQAWASGPVVRKLYNIHSGQFQVDDLPKGNIENLESGEIETIDAVLKAYAGKPAQWLSDLSHMEEPWLKAREGIQPGQNCENEITPTSLEQYYSSMPPDSEPV